MDKSLSALRRALLAAGLFPLLAGPRAAHAADVSWTNAAGGNWNTSANWNHGSGAVPGAGDSARLTQTASYTVTVYFCEPCCFEAR